MTEYTPGDTIPWHQQTWGFWAIAIIMTILPSIGGFAGSLITIPNIKSWYELIKKPEWRPPNGAFGPVWSVLYILMGVASFLVWKDADGVTRRNALIVYFTNLFLNWIWTPIFFGLHQVRASFFVIVVLDVVVVIMAVLFFKINKVAGAMIFPYILWLCIATALNASIWRLNGPVPEPVVNGTKVSD